MRCILLGLAFLTSTAYAGDWHPNPDERYRLIVSGSGYQPTDGDRRWAESLVANLRKKGGVVRSWEIAPRYPSAAVQRNDAPTSYQVFRQGSHAQYLVIAGAEDDQGSFLIDFHAKYILSIGIPTTSVHVHPSGRFAVVIYSHEPVVYGIPVSEYSEVTFQDQSASWFGDRVP